MNQFNYAELMADLISKTRIQNNFIYDYSDSKIKSEFEEAFQFYQNTMKNMAKSYTIEPSIFFYNQDEGLSMNAGAGKIDGYSMVTINKDLLQSIADMFLLNEELIKDVPELSLYVEFEEFFLDVPLNVMMHQMALHFTFYHEMGHIIQKSDLATYATYEYLDNMNQYSDRNHVIENDADAFSALNLATHILQYNESLFGDDLVQENLEKLIIISCSAAFLYILSFRSNQVPFYLKEKTHPHPVIRNTWVVSTVVSHIQQIFDQKKINISLDFQGLINRTLQFSQELLNANKLLSDILYRGYMEALEQNADQIQEYVREFNGIMEKDESLAVYKRNQIALSKK